MEQIIKVTKEYECGCIYNKDDNRLRCLNHLWASHYTLTHRKSDGSFKRQRSVGNNYSYILFNLWKPHSFEASRHSYHLYFEWKHKMIGLFPKKKGRLGWQEKIYLRQKGEV